MDEVEIALTNNICFGCLRDENIHTFAIKCEALKSILQIDNVNLCYICKRIGQQAEQFILNVQSNQIMLENFNLIDPTNLHSLKEQVQPIIELSTKNLDVIEFDENTSSDYACQEVVSVGKSRISVILKEEKDDLDVKVKKETIHSDLDDDFIDSSDYPLLDIKAEECKEFPDLVKNEFLVSKKCLKRVQKNKVAKKTRSTKTKDSKNSVLNALSNRYSTKRVYITKEQCLEEKAQMALDEVYLNSKYKCEDCVKGFAFKDSYYQHMERHHESKGDFECDICHQRTVSESKLVDHYKVHVLRYKCPCCDAIRRNRECIRDHFYQKHKSGLHYEFRCSYCVKVFSRKTALRKHIYRCHTTKERVICAYCNKDYVSKDVLSRHIKMKHSDGAYRENLKHICPECGKGFSAPSLLKMHSVKHSSKRDYYCVECDRSFKTETILQQHLKTSAPHINYIELRFSCTECGTKFASKRNMQRHMNRIHLNIRPYQCDLCEKAYNSSWGLKDHKKLIHEGYKRPMRFACEVCGRMFDRRTILRGHMRTHTGERPYQCRQCPAQFTQAGALGTHVKLIHLKLTRDGKPKNMALK